MVSIYRKGVIVFDKIMTGVATVCVSLYFVSPAREAMSNDEFLRTSYERLNKTDYTIFVFSFFFFFFFFFFVTCFCSYRI